MRRQTGVHLILSFAMICGYGGSPAFAQTAEDTVMFLLTGLQDETRYNNFIAKAGGNGVLSIFTTETPPAMHATITIKQPQTCAFEVTFERPDSPIFKDLPRAKGPRTFLVDFNKSWSVRLGQEGVPYVHGKNIACDIDTAKCADMSLFAAGARISETRLKEAEKYFRDTYCKGRAF